MVKCDLIEFNSEKMIKKSRLLLLSNSQYLQQFNRIKYNDF